MRDLQVAPVVKTHNLDLQLLPQGKHVFYCVDLQAKVLNEWPSCPAELDIKLSVVGLTFNSRSIDLAQETVQEWSSMCAGSM